MRCKLHRLDLGHFYTFFKKERAEGLGFSKAVAVSLSDFNSASEGQNSAEVASLEHVHLLNEMWNMSCHILAVGKNV